MLIVGAIELGDGNIPGRLRLAEISSYGAADLGHFVETAADPDAIAKTDGWSGYAAVPADRHNVHVVGKTAAHLVLPWIHQVFSNLKGWARGVYHGLRRKHLQAYLDEFVFRFNRRKTRHAAFRSLFRLATNAEPLTYSMLIEPEAMCISGSTKTPKPCVRRVSSHRLELGAIEKGVGVIRGRHEIRYSGMGERPSTEGRSGDRATSKDPRRFFRCARGVSGMLGAP